MRTDIANIASQANDVGEFKVSIKEWAKSLADDPRIVDAIFCPAVMSDLGGQLFVRNIELTQNRRLLADDRRPAFLNLPFQEALDYWVSQGGSPKTLERVLGLYRSNAEAGAELMLDTLSQRAIDRIEASIADGSTLRDFARGVREDSIALGISPESSSYLETVFRTNVQTAYGAGRFAQLTEPAVIAARPFVQYRTAGDNRVRANHEALDGMIFLASDAEWHRIAPPCGYNCRCSVCSLDREDVIDELSRGARISSSITPDMLQDIPESMWRGRIVANTSDLLSSGPDEASFAGPPTQPIAA